MSAGTGIDPRGPRFAAGVTALSFLVVIGFALGGLELAAVVLAGFNAGVFAWSAFAGVRRHPYGVLFRRLIRPRLRPPAELEDPVPPTFAQGVGLVVIGIGIVLHVLGVPLALVVASAAAFAAAFLNAAFDFCLGCRIYLLLARAGVLRRA